MYKCNNCGSTSYKKIGSKRICNFCGNEWYEEDEKSDKEKRNKFKEEMIHEVDNIFKYYSLPLEDYSIVDLKNEIENMKEQNSNLEANISYYREKIEDLQNDLSNQSQSYQEQIDDLQKQKQEILDKQNELNLANNKSKEFAQLVKRLEETEKVLDNVKSNIKNETAEKAALIKDLQKQKQEILDKQNEVNLANNKSKEFAELAKRLEETENLLSNVQSNFEKETAAKTALFNDLVEKNKHLEQKQNDQQDVIDLLKEQIQESLPLEKEATPEHIKELEKQGFTVDGLLASANSKHQFIPIAAMIRSNVEDNLIHKYNVEHIGEKFVMEKNKFKDMIKETQNKYGSFSYGKCNEFDPDKNQYPKRYFELRPYLRFIVAGKSLDVSKKAADFWGKTNSFIHHSDDNVKIVDNLFKQGIEFVRDYFKNNLQFLRDNDLYIDYKD